MECETEENSEVARLPLFSVPRVAMESPERSGILTPPIFTTASVPFRWEEEPGKPRLSSGGSGGGGGGGGDGRTSLELPPRLLLLDKLSRSECCCSFRMMDEKGSLLMRKRGWFRFGSWRRDFGLRGKRDEVGVGGLVFPSSVDRESVISHSKVEITRFRRNGSFSSLSTQTRPHFWESVCEGLKHVVPWRSKRVKRERL